ncbi:MAG: hypothetical protein JW818_12470 [Pirellulales bacterium]|nr:hypothetical protein [Pirellulales bacterium]
MTRHFCRMWWLPCMAALLLAPTAAMANKQAKVQPKQVEMFKAIEAGQIEVKLIPKDSTETRVAIINKTKEPLSVKLPDAFAGVPALAQFQPQPPGGGLGFGQPGLGGGGGGNNFGNGGGNNNQNQSFGGGMGGGMMGGGMGMFNVPPGKIGRLKVPTVCLEHGKKDPASNIPYVIKPIESYTDKPAVQELCRMLGTGKLSQRAAQAAAWHLSNDMSWQELAAKQIRHITGMTQPYFNPMEIRAAMQIANLATARAKEREESTPVESMSASK